MLLPHEGEVQLVDHNLVTLKYELQVVAGLPAQHLPKFFGNGDVAVFYADA